MQDAKNMDVVIRSFGPKPESHSNDPAVHASQCSLQTPEITQFRATSGQPQKSEFKNVSKAHIMAMVTAW
jgi:hypothetical protein